jgi:integrase
LTPHLRPTPLKPIQPLRQRQNQRQISLIRSRAFPLTNVAPQVAGLGLQLGSQFRNLRRGRIVLFKGAAIRLLLHVVLAAGTGMRRNELLALRWTDLDTEKKTLRIERAWEQTKKYGLRLKPPKTRRGLRTIGIDDALIALLLKEKERHQRIKASIPDGVVVDLSLMKLPASALMFPAVPETGEDFDFAKPRNPRNFSKEFARRADWLREHARKLSLPSFGKTRFHDLRGIHSTALLDAGIPVHTVAQRIGDDPAVLLRTGLERRMAAYLLVPSSPFQS